MKKLLGIIIVGLLLSGNAYAKAKLGIHFKNDNMIVIESSNGMFSHFWGRSSKEREKNLDKASSISKEHCNIYSKKTYLFRGYNLEDGEQDGFFAIKGKGEFDIITSSYKYHRIRFICANNLEDALKILKEDINNNEIATINSKDYFLYNLDGWRAEKFKKVPETLITEKLKKKEEKIAEKPKKKKPKQLPDDNKVVAASSGTGFIVSKQGHIITNNHVVDSCNTMKVTFNGNEVDAKTLAVDKMNDIAILKANIKPESIFPVSNDDVSLLEDVVVAGYPLGKRVSSAIKTHKGVVTALAGAGDNYSNFQTDASINQGNSGGPIMNQKGNIVGIAVATWVQEGVQGVHFGIKSSTLKTFANSNNLKFSSPNYLELSNKDLGKLITDATVYLECHMTVAKIKRIIAEANNRKAFFSEYQ
ncbi:serine protease [Candidatus Pelagibacter sp. Uisw_092]|uniref:S1C family serine protease n=1 Tax=Candidatus Pelagibacter sp. Uisw_092 TaxID=3230979 RepID=UPI0039E8B2D5